MRKMPLKIGYFGDEIWAQNALRLILRDENFKVCFVTPRFDAPDEVLLSLAKQHNIPIIHAKNVNSPEFAAKIAPYKCDLLVSMSFNQIFKENLLSNYEIINTHAGKLPFYRGRNILNWALINDEKEFGITVHFVDSGIDTGDIILQKCYEIGENDDYNTLLHLAYDECANLLYEALKLYIMGEIVPIKQESIDKIGSYYPQRKAGDEIIDFSKGVREIFNFIRALNAPNLGALAFVDKKEIRLFKSQIYSENSAMPLDKGLIKSENSSFDENLPNGFVLSVDEMGFLMKLKDGILRVNKYKFKNTLKNGTLLVGKGE